MNVQEISKPASGEWKIYYGTLTDRVYDVRPSPFTMNYRPTSRDVPQSVYEHADGMDRIQIVQAINHKGQSIPLAVVLPVVW